MKLPEEGMLLRIFIGESDIVKGKPLYERIVLKARELNEVVAEGLITLEKIRVIKYGHK